MLRPALLVALLLVPAASKRLKQTASTLKQADEVDEAVEVDEADEPGEAQEKESLRRKFSFMTNDLQKPDHHAGFFGTIFYEWWGDRAATDVKEEIVSGHTCAKKTQQRDETYYASSFCYWLPDVQHKVHQAPGLAWVGGAYPNGHQLCQGLAASGKCLKCSACHNNGRDADGTVDRTAFAEEIPLPEGCLTESAVEATCVQEYDSSSSMDEEMTRCNEVKTRYNAAVQPFEECEQKLKELPHAIEVTIPNLLQVEQNKILKVETELNGAKRDVVGLCSKMYNDCKGYVGSVKTKPSWMRKLRFARRYHSRTVSRILRDVGNIKCSKPIQPRKPRKPQAPTQPPPRREWGAPPTIPVECETTTTTPKAIDASTEGQAEGEASLVSINEVPQQPEGCVSKAEVEKAELELKSYKEGKAAEERAWQNYDKLTKKYEKDLPAYPDLLEKFTTALLRFQDMVHYFQDCKRCHDASDELAASDEKVDKVEERLIRAKDGLPALHERLAKTKLELQDWEAKYPPLLQKKEQMAAEWLPQEEICEAAAHAYDAGRQIHLQDCAPKYYDQSCEKACIEKTSKEAGCGVIEASKPEDGLAVGGLEVSCRPPQPSWILSPYTYGAQPNETDQCERITANQKPWYSQKILKKGWLRKKGGSVLSCVDGNCWDKRYFVLESGDEVRSAVLRYFAKDPFQSFSEWKEIEREDKGIIMWDAKGIAQGPVDNYDWDDGSECFHIEHFYRDYELCVPGRFDDGSGKSPSEHREEWMSLLEQAIAHQV